MDVIVQLAPAVADAVLAQDAGSPAANAVLETLAPLGLSLEPLHPGIDDAELRTFFRVAVADEQQGQEVVAALLPLEGVDAAYLQPDAGLPEGLP